MKKRVIRAVQAVEEQTQTRKELQKEEQKQTRKVNKKKQKGINKNGGKIPTNKKTDQNKIKEALFDVPPFSSPNTPQLYKDNQWICTSTLCKENNRTCTQTIIMDRAEAVTHINQRHETKTDQDTTEIIENYDLYLCTHCNKVYTTNLDGNKRHHKCTHTQIAVKKKIIQLSKQNPNDINLTISPPNSTSKQQNTNSKPTTTTNPKTTTTNPKTNQNTTTPSPPTTPSSTIVTPPSQSTITQSTTPTTTPTTQTPTTTQNLSPETPPTQSISQPISPSPKPQSLNFSIFSQHYPPLQDHDQPSPPLRRRPRQLSLQGRDLLKAVIAKAPTWDTFPTEAARLALQQQARPAFQDLLRADQEDNQWKIYQALNEIQKIPQASLQKPRGGYAEGKKLATKIAQAAIIQTAFNNQPAQPAEQLHPQHSIFTEDQSGLLDPYSSSDDDDDEDDEDNEGSQEALNCESNRQHQGQDEEDDGKGTQAIDEQEGTEAKEHEGQEDEDHALQEDEDHVLHQKIRRATAQAKRGNIKRALQILTQGKLRKINSKVEKELRAKHPTPHQDAVPPETPSYPKNIVDQELLLKVLRGLRNGSARSPAGWTPELLYDIAKDDPVIASAVTALSTRILNNDLNKASRFQLTLSRLIAAAKGEDDIRPLTIAELFYKLAAAYAIRLKKDVISRLLEPLGQFGIGAQGGAQRALHLVQILLETSGQQATGLFIDLKNMYNDFNRYEALRYLYSLEELQDLWGIAAFSYGSPSPLVMETDQGELSFILSEWGARQGDALGCLLACLQIIQSMEKLKAGQRNHSENVAIVDDIVNIATDPFDALQAFDNLKKDKDIRINMQKSFIFYAHQEQIPEGLEEACKVRGLNIRTGSVTHLGAVVGVDDEAVSRHAMAKVEACKPLMDILLNPHMPAQTAFTLLKQTMANRIGYLLRTQPPGLIRDAAEEFDDMVTTTLCQKHGVTPCCSVSSPPTQDEIKKFLLFHHHMHAAQNAGGLGIYSAAANAEAAFYAALNATAQQVPHLFDNKNKSSLHCHLDYAYDALRENGVPTSEDFPANDEGPIFSSSVLPQDKDDFLAFYKEPYSYGKLFRQQRVLSQELSKRRQEYLSSLLDKRETVILRSQACPESSAWLNARGDTNATRFADPEFNESLRRFFDNDLHPNVKTCVCDKPLNYPGAKDHFHLCIKFRRIGITNRHNDIVKAICNYCTSRGVNSIAEIANGYDDDRRRPDSTHFCNGGKMVTTDTTVRYPAAPSNVDRAHKRPLSVLQQADTQKRARYAESASQVGAEFFPVSMETNGRMSKSTKDFIRTMAMEANLDPGETRKDVERELITIISCVLMKGTAKLFLHSSKLCLMRGHQRPKRKLVRAQEAAHEDLDGDLWIYEDGDGDLPL